MGLTAPDAVELDGALSGIERQAAGILCGRDARVEVVVRCRGARLEAAARISEAGLDGAAVGLRMLRDVAPGEARWNDDRRCSAAEDREDRESNGTG